MKYLFINSVAGWGSTGRIAAEQCRELMAQGHSCVLAFGRGEVKCPDVPTMRIGSDLDNNLHGIRTRLLDDHGFGSAAATRHFLEQVREFDPDVIWMHNVHGYYIHIGLLFDYLRSCGKKIYWTLHDCWSFTGHCSYFDFAECDRWKTGCHHCPQKDTYPASKLLDGSKSNYLRKKALFAGIPNLTVVTPSKWLAGLVKESFLKEYPVEVRYNPIDTNTFKPTESDFRQKHGLVDKKILLGVAGVWEERKGMRDFVKLAAMLDTSWKIVLVGVPEDMARTLPGQILALPRTSSAMELAQIYSAADVFANPTYEDNLPTVNLEARACGTRIVSYDTGGCAETLAPEDILIPKGDIQAFYNAILKAGA